ncbi:hypothetical protein [Rubellimicrobium arenae]|uniref:hypothetical protein n=1 Tax=Rubellimicrobium arenae TaxID=2817372 RepID=UPI001B309689|nr:hypothetical protein [Rubellimicrobium arenae]
MPQRSATPRVLDDAAFPLRVKLHVPALGLGPVLIEVLRWLRNEVGEDNFAHHDAETLEAEALAIYFRRADHMMRFLHAFPNLGLADETGLPSYHNPRTLKRLEERRVKGSGRRGR